MRTLDDLMTEWDNTGPPDVRDELIEVLARELERRRWAYRRLSGLVWTLVAVLMGIGVALKIFAPA